MRALTFVLVAGVGLVACNGGSDSDTPAASTDPAAAPATTNSESTPSAADTANSVRETVQALSPTSDALASSALATRPSPARDPGPRTTTGDAGGMLDGLSTAQQYAFGVGKADF